MVRVKRERQNLVATRNYKNVFQCPECGLIITFYFCSDYKCKHCGAVLPAVDCLVKELDYKQDRARPATIYYHRREEKGKVCY